MLSDAMDDCVVGIIAAAGWQSMPGHQLYCARTVAKSAFFNFCDRFFKISRCTVIIICVRDSVPGKCRSDVSLCAVCTFKKSRTQLQFLCIMRDSQLITISKYAAKQSLSLFHPRLLCLDPPYRTSVWAQHGIVRQAYTRITLIFLKASDELSNILQRVCQVFVQMVLRRRVLVLVSTALHAPCRSVRALLSVVASDGRTVIPTTVARWTGSACTWAYITGVLSSPTAWSSHLCLPDILQVFAGLCVGNQIKKRSSYVCLTQFTCAQTDRLAMRCVFCCKTVVARTCYIQFYHIGRYPTDVLIKNTSSTDAVSNTEAVANTICCTREGLFCS